MGKRSLSMMSAGWASALVMSLAQGTSLDAAEPRPASAPSAWKNLQPDLSSHVIKRISDVLPLSDQRNKAGWRRHEPMWDEFDGPKLDRAKWSDHNPEWKGRQPGYFHPDNVAVREGKLHLTMRKGDLPGMPKDAGYHTYTCAAVQSKSKVRYGYFEVMATPMRSAGSSSFWFYDSTKEWWTEIDVYEIGGGAPGFERKVNMNVHVFHTPQEKRHWAIPGSFVAPRKLADADHVYGLDWSKKEIRFYFDGVLVRRGPNTHWHQPLTLNFDSETMPKWFGLPKDEDLPSTYSVEYVRAWKRAKRP